MGKRGSSRGDFVLHANGDFQGRPQVITLEARPRVSIVIPTLDGDRNGYLPALIEQIKAQSVKDIEIILVRGDRRQGRAINQGALIARGDILVTMDDDTRLGHERVIENMVAVLHAHPDIGIVGVSNVVPEDASLLTRLAMDQIPRRRSPLVSQITDSDMAEHPCMAIPKSLFYRIGGENELIPRGLDPYLRFMVRKAGYRVVVIPGTWIHHLPPPGLLPMIRQFFRNGKGAAFCQKFYPQWVLELTRTHTTPDRVHRGMPYRMVRNVFNLVISLTQGKIVFFITQLSYLAGFGFGLLTLREDRMQREVHEQ
ncbi:MAG: glycosyltransferase [bacterium]